MIQSIVSTLKNHSNELGRKVLHISTVILCLGLVSIFNPGGVAFIITCISILVFLADTLNFLDFFKNVRRISFGHYFMSLGIILTLVFYSITKNYSAYVFALLVLGICDPLAVFGRPFYNFLVQSRKFYWLKSLTFAGKTITGSLIFFLSTLILSLIILMITGVNLHPSLIAKIILSVALLTATEFWSIWGIDNLTLPVGSYLLFEFIISKT